MIAPAIEKKLMKTVAASIEDVEEALKDAAHDPSAWPSALSVIDAFLESSGVVLLCVDERLKHAPRTANVEEMMEDYVKGGWYGRDLRESCVPLLRKQGYALDFQFQNISKIESTEYYHDFLRRHGQKWFAGIGASIDHDLWCLAIQRSKNKEAFQLSDISKLRMVQARLAESARIASGVSRAWIAGALEALQTIGEAAFVLDWNGRLLHANRSGHQLVASFIGRDGRLILPDAEAAKSLDLLISNRTWKLSATYLSPTRPFLIDKTLYRLEVTSLLSEPSITLSKAAILGRLRPSKLDIEDVLRHRFGLTDAEIRITLAVHKGISVKDVCSNFRLSENTVRSHLKKVFWKTNVTSQAKLVSFVYSLL